MNKKIDTGKQLYKMKKHGNLIDLENKINEILEKHYNNDYDGYSLELFEELVVYNDNNDFYEYVITNLSKWFDVGNVRDGMNYHNYKLRYAMQLAIANMICDGYMEKNKIEIK